MDNVKSLYEAARGGWTCADWAHNLRRDGHEVLGDGSRPSYCDGEPRPVLCDGQADCETCSEATADADAAETLAAAAMIAFGSGKIDAAKGLAVEAEALERAWGDSPTWGAWADAIKALHEYTAGHSTPRRSTKRGTRP